MSRSSGWDRWSRVYQPLERLALGGCLQRTRTEVARQVGCLAAPAATEAPDDAPQLWLVVGDGNGRGLELMCHAAPKASFVSVDGSSAMIEAARRRLLASSAQPTELAARVRWVQGQLPDGPPNAVLPSRVSGIITSFFLDCFSPEELAPVWTRLASLVRPGGHWIVADFTSPNALSGLQAWRQRALLGLLYPAFRLTTPMTARALADFDAPFRAAGWHLAFNAPGAGPLTRIVGWKKPARSPKIPPSITLQPDSP